MHYIIQSNIYKEVNFGLLIHALKNLDLSFETVKILPFIDSYEFETTSKNVFAFGGVKLAKIISNLDFTPGSLFDKTEEFETYLQYFKNDLLNSDSTIHNVNDEFRCQKNIQIPKVWYCLQFLQLIGAMQDIRASTNLTKTTMLSAFWILICK